ncbi:hypothetical protein GCM10023176_53710 [Micromonospora coerulea]|uniref:Glyoxalase-like domain-containing protein n=2 Tax=Micromonospora coerulea TaxID=47856 RepID=A0ABP8T3C8_9ACTN
MFRTPQVILFSEDVSRAAAFYAGLGFTWRARPGRPAHLARPAADRLDRRPDPARPAPAGLKTYGAFAARLGGV